MKKQAMKNRGTNSKETTMEALVLREVGDLRLESVKKPAPGPGEVLVRVAFCGVCGSDIPRVFEKGTYSFPTVPGHEFSGTVETLGEGVDGFEQGEEVVVFPLVWCGDCPACEEGSYAQCLDYDYLGSRSGGAFTEYAVAPAQHLLPIPEEVSLEAAAMTEPAAVALHAMRRAGGCDAGETVAVFGAGPIGLMVAQWARMMGAGRAVLFDLVPEKLEMAQDLGFGDVFNASEGDPVEVVNDLTSGQGADVCIEAAGFPATFEAALGSVRRGGRAVLLGNPATDGTLPAPLWSQLMRREVRIVGTWNSDYSLYRDTDDWRTVLDALAGGVIDLESLVTHNVPLMDGPDIFKMMRDKLEFFSKVLIHP